MKFLLVKGLGYSEASAHRRIMASRALKIDVSIGEKLEQGSLNLTQLAQVTQLSRQAKQQPSLTLFEKLENKGKSATEQILAESFKIKPKEITHTRTQRDESVRLEVTFSKEQFEALKVAKSHLSHICPDGDWADVLSELAKRLNKKYEPSVKVDSKISPNSKSPEFINTPPAGLKPKIGLKRKAVGLPLKRYLLDKADGCCQHRDLRTGERCSTRYQLQVDHIRPLAKDGDYSTENLQILCGLHNRWKGARLVPVLLEKPE